MLDGDNVLNEKIKLVKEVYTSDELVSMDDKLLEIAMDVTNSFIETFKNRGGATKEQIDFANETAKIVFGILVEKYVIGIPAPCGFGKSSITLEILKKMVEMLKLKLTTDGIIIVTDRLESLRETQKELNEMGLGGYTYILESWNEEMCMNKKIKQSDSKICTPKKCSFFSSCKICFQQTEQAEKPILLITNARLREGGENINRYKDYNGGERKTLIIDERPDVLDVVKVHKSLLNEISTELSKCEYICTEEKTNLENKFKEICDTLIGRMQRLRTKYKRFIVSNISNDIICKNDEEFMSLWNKYMGNNRKRELAHIHKVLTSGGFYVYEKNTEFITTIGSRDLNDMYSDTFKTIIFDGTALYDPLYLSMYINNSIKFLDIENTRIYNNLSITSYSQHKLTRTNFKDKKYLVKACAEFINNKMRIGMRKAFVVTYQNQAVELSSLLKHKGNIPQLNEAETYYFGNTKGKNTMQECTRMFQIGWNTMSDYEYVIQWLSASTVKWEKVIEACANIEKAEEMSELLTIKDRSAEQYGSNTYRSQFMCYEYGLQGINHFKMFSMVTDFYQEVHRTKLRNYSCTDKIEVHMFAVKSIILNMIERLFPKDNGKLINIVKDDLIEFTESKADNRANKGVTYTKFKAWLDIQTKGRSVTSKELLSESGLNSKSLNKSKSNNSFVREWFKVHTTSKGNYLI